MVVTTLALSVASYAVTSAGQGLLQYAWGKALEYIADESIAGLGAMVKVRLSPPVDEGQRQLAWTMYVELVTRISIVEMPDDEGIDHEAMSSLHILFGNLRSALVAAGPTAAKTSESGTAAIGSLVLLVLEVRLRPFLQHWHTRHARWKVGVGDEPRSAGSEQVWPDHPAFRADLRQLQRELRDIASTLEQMLQLEGPMSAASLFEPRPEPETS